MSLLPGASSCTKLKLRAKTRLFDQEALAWTYAAGDPSAPNSAELLYTAFGPSAAHRATWLGGDSYTSQLRSL